jgi:hypothetical protein
MPLVVVTKHRDIIARAGRWLDQVSNIHADQYNEYAEDDQDCPHFFACLAGVNSCMT